MSPIYMHASQYFLERDLLKIHDVKKEDAAEGFSFSKKIFYNKKTLGIFTIFLLLLGSIASFYFIPTFFPHNNIGIIEIYGPITSFEKYKLITDMVDFSRNNEAIKAVVLIMDCPGGYAHSIQDIYMNLLDLRESKPIVACIVGLGVSGGYYIPVSANYIYAVPAAMVGNIGVIATLPEKPVPLEDVLETGPYKQRGTSETYFPFEVQSTLDDFLNAVELQREETLNVTRTELSKGLMYMGNQAFKNGLVDEIGSSQDAIRKAAELARISEYSVVIVNEMVEKPTNNSSNISNDYSGLTLDTLLELRDPPAFYYIYANPEISSNEQTISTSFPSKEIDSKINDMDFILVDTSHNNAFARWELNILLYEVSIRGHSFRYLNSSKYLDEMLNNSVALIIINPQTYFSDQEISTIKDYVKSGGKLLLMADPTRNSASYINSLSADFGLVFGMGYLYNLDKNFGNYRNIIIDDLQKNNMTKGLQKIVFYTATHVLSKSNNINKPDSFLAQTYSSESEKTIEYSPWAYLPDERILAVGDQTLLMEPYCHTFDNYRFIENMADFLTS